MRVANIKLESTAEVRDHFADVIHFQGCSRRCSYCFNPTLIPFGGGEEMSSEEIVESLSELSDVVVLTGGEPLEQPVLQLQELIIKLKFKKKRIVVETSLYHPLIYNMCDKILYCIKTFDVDMETLENIRYRANVDFCIVFGHDDFNMEGFKIAHTFIRTIYHRFDRDIPRKFNEILNYIMSLRKNFLVFNKIEL